MKHLRRIDENLKNISYNLEKMIDVNSSDHGLFKFALNLEEGKTDVTYDGSNQYPKEFPTFVNVLKKMTPEIKSALYQDFLNLIKFPTTISYMILATKKGYIDVEMKNKNVKFEFTDNVRTTVKSKKDVAHYVEILKENGYAMYDVRKLFPSSTFIHSVDFSTDDMEYIVAMMKKITSIADMSNELDFLKMLSQNPDVARSKKLSQLNTGTGMFDE